MFFYGNLAELYIYLILILICKIMAVEYIVVYVLYVHMSTKS